MIQRARRTAAALAAAAMTTAVVLAGVAMAGSFGYPLNDSAHNVWQTRNVDHDYSYLQGSTGASITTCLQRNTTGTVYCSTATISHSYPDSCNPSACITLYLQQSGTTKTISAYDEWR